jgi:hypothetical protein
MPSPEALQIELRAPKLVGAFLLLASTGLATHHLLTAPDNPLRNVPFALAYAVVIREQFNAQRRIIRFAGTRPTERGSPYFFQQADQFWTYAKPLTLFALDGALGPVNNPVCIAFGAMQATWCTVFAYQGKAHARSLVKEEAETAVAAAVAAARADNNKPQ